MRTARTTLFVVLSWLVVTIAAAVASWSAVSVAGAAVAPKAPSLSGPEVASALASTTAGPVSAASEATPDAATQPVQPSGMPGTTGSPSSQGPAGTPAAPGTPKPAAPAQSVAPMGPATTSGAAQQVVTGEGGTAAARCANDVPQLVYAVPKSGFGYRQDDVETVEFVSQTHRTVIHLVCAAGALRATVEEQARTGSGGYDD